MNINMIINEMNHNNEESRDLPGIGTVYLKKDRKIPYLLYVPEKLDDKERLVVEANNCESPKYRDVVNQATNTLFKGYRILKGTAPVLVPIIPTEPNKPYYQQLSRDAFYEENPLHVEEELSGMIKESLDIIEQTRNVRLDDKVFMMGYSSSGVFAQRFALFHPEQIDELVIGGASGSIPVPTSKIEYPLGIGGLKDFDSDSYSKIKFRYYVGEYETVNLAMDRCEVVNGEIIREPLPMHDMTNFDRSVNPYTGKIYKDYFGEDYFKRLDNVVKLYKDLGLDIDSQVIKGRAHKNVNVGDVFFQGVRELENPIIDNAYQESVASLSNNMTK